MRKLILFAVFALLSNIAFSQSNVSTVNIHNFILTDGEVFWQKTYDNIDSTTCINYFNSSLFTKENDQYKCSITLANYSSKRAMSRAFILNEPCVIDFTLQVKKNKYRITVSNIIWESTHSVGVSFGSGVVAGNSTKSYTDLKFYAYNKKGKITFKENGTIPSQVDEALQLLFNATKNQQGEKHTEILNSEF